MPNLDHLAPTWANSGRSGASGPNMTQLDPVQGQLQPKLSPSWSWAKSAQVCPKHVGPAQVRFNMVQLGANLAAGSHQVGADVERTWETLLNAKLHQCQKNVGNRSEQGISRISYWACLVPHVENVWSSTWAGVLPNVSNLGPSCAMLDPSLVQVGAKWVQVGRKLGPCSPRRPQVEPMLLTCLLENREFGLVPI